VYYYHCGVDGYYCLCYDGRFAVITFAGARTICIMKTYNGLWEKVCSYKNLELAFKNARRHKTLKPYVIDFEKNLEENLSLLRTELLLHAYHPMPLKTFILRDPKTRKISKSDFRDRIIHHALCNVIEPIFERRFIYDSYANRKGKGTLKAIKRFDAFKRKVFNKQSDKGYLLKADIKHYFDTVDHKILLSILKRRIKDARVIWLIKQILCNFNTTAKGKGMPLGNLTSQFFANVYLNELDQFAKHKLKAKYYIRYVDDFVILHKNKKFLQEAINQIEKFIRKELALELHPNKCKIIDLKDGSDFLGFRIFYYYKLLRKSNIRKMQRKIKNYKCLYDEGKLNYDIVYEFFQNWCAYARNANTHTLRKTKGMKVQEYFPKEVSTIEVNRLVKDYNKAKFEYLKKQF